jgi:hypothetical protein
VLHAFGEEVTILRDGEQTGGRLTMWPEATTPGGGPPLHFHINDDERFFVMEGTRRIFPEQRLARGGPRRIGPWFRAAGCTSSKR